MGSASTIKVRLLPPEQEEAGRRAGLLALILYSLGHFSVDLYSSALSVFQPVLGERLGLSLTQAGWLAGLLVVSSSMTQPLYGYLSDRYQSRLFSELAPAVAAVFLSCLGLAPSYGWALLLVLVGGAGAASFHPQASARAVSGITRDKSRWMAVFISAGTLGVALGPVYFSLLQSVLRPEHVPLAAIPGVAVSILLFTWMPRLRWAGAPRRVNFDRDALLRHAKPLLLLFALVFVRSVVQVIFGQFLPLYLSRERGWHLPQAALALTSFVAAGALGGFVGGHLAAWFGAGRIIQFSMVGCLPFFVLFLAGPDRFAIPMLALGGLILFFTIPVNVVLAQELVPSQAGTISALMMGFAWGSAGLAFIPLAGFLADRTSLHAVLSTVAFAPVAGFALCFKLPRDGK